MEILLPSSTLVSVEYSQQMITKKVFKDINNAIGKEIFRMFGIDPITYAKVFNDYPHKTKMPTVDVTSKCDKGAIQDLLQYAIGHGYWMVHGGTTGGVKVYEIDEAYMKESINDKWTS